MATFSLVDVPFFSRTSKEKAERFLNMCHLAFVLQARLYLNADDHEQAQFLFMSIKLQDFAAAFYLSLPDKERLSWKGATKRLRERFASAAGAVQKRKALSESSHLIQGSMSLAEYAAKGQRLLDVLAHGLTVSRRTWSY